MMICRDESLEITSRGSSLLVARRTIRRSTNSCLPSRCALSETHRRIYLCPDLNPIENAFSKFKWLLRCGPARSIEALWEACGQLLQRFTQDECLNYIRHAGYRYL